MKGYISNKQFKIIEGIIWTMATISVIVLVCTLYQLKEVKGDIKVYKVQIRK